MDRPWGLKETDVTEWITLSLSYIVPSVCVFALFCFMCNQDIMPSDIPLSFMTFPFAICNRNLLWTYLLGFSLLFPSCPLIPTLLQEGEHVFVSYLYKRIISERFLLGHCHFCHWENLVTAGVWWHNVCGQSLPETVHRIFSDSYHAQICQPIIFWLTYVKLYWGSSSQRYS